MSIDVSVVIPTFRRPQQLRACLISALGQQGVTVEVVVLDDSPEGSARAIIEEIGAPNVSYIRRTFPSGGNPSLVRNEGWPRATGRYIHFLDDDDMVADGAYAVAVRTLDRNPDRGVAFGIVQPFGDDPEVLRHEQKYFRNAALRARLASRLGSRRSIVLNMLFKTTLLVNSACLIRRSCLPELGGYDTRVTVIEDVEFYSRAIRRFGGVFLDRVVAHYRTGGPSMMHDRVGNDEILNGYRIMYDAYRRAYGGFDLLLLKVLAHTVFRWL